MVPFLGSTCQRGTRRLTEVKCRGLRKWIYPCRCGVPFSPFSRPKVMYRDAMSSSSFSSPSRGLFSVKQKPLVLKDAILAIGGDLENEP
nr:kti11 [Cressdnaviricota sp.]